MVWDRLSKSVQRMECMRSVRGWHDPFMVRLVEVLVDQRMVFHTVNPINEEVGEENEEWELQKVVPETWALLGRVVHLAIASDLC